MFFHNEFDFYIASPFFTDKDLEEVKKIENYLQSNSMKFFSPRLSILDSTYSEFTGDKNLIPQLIFEENINNINHSNVVIVNLEGFDSGTLFELGYAMSRDKRIILYNNHRNLTLADYAKDLKEVYSHMILENYSYQFDKFTPKEIKVSLPRSILAENVSNFDDYYGKSKVLLGYIYGEMRNSPRSNDIKLINFIDTPRKSNLMLSVPFTIYETDNLFTLTNLKKVDSLTIDSN